MAQGVKIVNLVRDPRSRFWSQINAKLYDLHLLNDARPHAHHRWVNGVKPHDAEDSTESETENPRRTGVIGYMRSRLPVVCKNNADDLRKSLTQVKQCRPSQKISLIGKTTPTISENLSQVKQCRRSQKISHTGKTMLMISENLRDR